MRNASYQNLRYVFAAVAAGTFALAAAPEAKAGTGEGFLEVATATEAYEDGQVTYYPHASYTVYRPDGSVAAWVENHHSKNDEAVERVILPEGRYRIHADGEPDFTVSVQAGHVTQVALDGASPRIAVR